MIEQRDRGAWVPDTVLMSYQPRPSARIFTRKKETTFRVVSIRDVLASSPFNHIVGLNFPIHLLWPMKCDCKRHGLLLDGSFMSQCTLPRALFPSLRHVWDGGCSISPGWHQKQNPCWPSADMQWEQKINFCCFNPLHYHCCRKKKYHPKFRGLKKWFILSHDSVGWPGSSGLGSPMRLQSAEGWVQWEQEDPWSITHSPSQHGSLRTASYEIQSIRCKVSWGLSSEVTWHHFHHVLLVTAQI